jgi:hypothetical protein
MGHHHKGREFPYTVGAASMLVKGSVAYDTIFPAQAHGTMAKIITFQLIAVSALHSPPKDILTPPFVRYIASSNRNLPQAAHPREIISPDRRPYARVLGQDVPDRRVDADSSRRDHGFRILHGWRDWTMLSESMLGISGAESNGRADTIWLHLAGTLVSTDLEYPNVSSLSDHGLHFEGSWAALS